MYKGAGVMNRLILCLTILTTIFISGCSEIENKKNFVYGRSLNTAYEDNMKRDLLCLMMAYPEYVVGVEKDSQGNVYAVMKSGKRILYDDKKTKSYEEKINNPDIQDMMEQIYPLDDIENLSEVNYDPGRIRVYPLLKEVYGGSKEEVLSYLVNLKMGYTNCQFNKNNNAAESLKCVMNELIPMAHNRKDIYSCVFPQGGTFNYRVISGTNRLSAHSFGIAIDLASNKGGYWKWASRSEGEKKLDSYPREIVKIFEKNNFIWGGKWGHFDIFHFEYRPEIILKARYFTNSTHKIWYYGVPEDDKRIKEYIDIIEGAVK